MDINRKTAYMTLLQIEKEGAYSNLALNENIDRSKADSPAFIRELTYGVLKNKYYLDFCLKAFVKKGFNKLKPEVITLLRMGAYQLMFMDSVPSYAAVSETVNLARKYARGREGFINGVLRAFDRAKNELPDIPRDDYSEYLGIKYSCEKWIVDLLIEAFGEEGAEKYLNASNETPELYIRVNVLKNSPEELTKELKALGFKVDKSELSERSLKVAGSGILEIEAFKAGRFSVQDEASTLAADILGAKKGMKVVDMCAAPGGKTMAIAELMETQGEVLACDVYEHKLKLIEEQAKRAGLTIVRTALKDGRENVKELEGTMDRVLSDVPCSGLGVIRRKPEIKYKEAFDMEALVETQKEIILNAASYLKPGGYLVYSTCTVNPAENQGVTDWFLEGRPNYTKVDERHLDPGVGTDGFYICKISREA